MLDTRAVGTRLVYVLPVHNEEAILEGTARTLVSWLEARPSMSGHVYLVENGSRDRSWPLAERLEKEASRPTVPVRAFREMNRGIGWAYHRGMTEAVAEFGPAEDAWVVLTAADLPFGFTDAIAAAPDLERGCPALIGSKAHPESQATTTLKRRLMTGVYKQIRRAVLGMRVGDSQGSLFLRLDFVAEMLPKIRARDFFFTTELCHLIEKRGERIVELPIALQPEFRPSTVRPVQDSLKMIKQLAALRYRSR